METRFPARSGPAPHDRPHAGSRDEVRQSRGRALAAAALLAAAAACSSPADVDIPLGTEASLEHTTSSGNHTTSSGNVSDESR